ncbi:DUF1240 domain-containing protein [Morganella psychrotolerans]|uniref:DUF1240 domain-containing protein n=1 Tax=Morganella psychrotolerans TaxID=368603 RepID=UPI0039AF4D6E
MVVDDSIKKKYNIDFGVFLLLIMSVVFIWLPSIYFLGYINKEDIVKIHVGMFFILCVPLLLYFSFGGIMILINKEMLLRKYSFFKETLNVLSCIAVLSFVFAVIGPVYMDNDLISKGYIKCRETSFRSSTIYVIDAKLCKK